MHRRLKIIYLPNTNEYNIFVEYIYNMHQRLKNKFVDYSYVYYKFKYIDVYKIHVDENSQPLVKHIKHEFQRTFLHVITYTCHDIDYMSHITITSDIWGHKQHIMLRWRVTHHVYKLHITNRRHATKHFTCYYITSQSLQIKGSHEPVSSHGRIGIC